MRLPDKTEILTGKEEKIFSKWTTFLFWSGAFCFFLKEFMNKSWEDFCGLWSIMGLISYFIFNNYSKNIEIPCKKNFLRLLHYYIVAFIISIIVIPRFINRLETDWASVVFVAILISILFDKQFSK